MKYDMNHFRKPWALKTSIFEDTMNYLKGENVSLPVKPAAEPAAPAGGDVKIIKLRGILSKEMDFFSYLFGGTSLEAVQDQFRAAIDNNEVKAIILDIDSPGGDVNGTPELAELIYNSRGKKPIISYIGYDGASAAYWVAAAADKIVVQEAAAVGSIGVLASFWKGETMGDEVTIVSSVSPKKALDLDTDEGVQQIQEMVDELGAIFVENVAKYRGIEPAQVLADFGQGGVKIARKAVESGMADYIGTIDDVYNMIGGSVNFNNRSKSTMSMTNDGKAKAQEDMVNPEEINREWLEENMPELIDEIKEDQAAGETINIDEVNLDWLKENKPELIDEIKEGAAADERERISEVEEEEENSEDTSDEAKAIWKAAKFTEPLKAAEALQKVHRLAAEKRKQMKEDRHEDAAGVPAVNSATAAGEDSVVTAIKAGIKKRKVN